MHVITDIDAEKYLPLNGMYLSYLVMENIINNRLQKTNNIREKLWCHTVNPAVKLFTEQGEYNYNKISKVKSKSNQTNYLINYCRHCWILRGGKATFSLFVGLPGFSPMIC